MKKVFSLIVVVFFTFNLFSQDTLPHFTLVENGNKAIISWTNPYSTLVQLNVQRSYDSLKNFSTIFSPPSPELAQNGYTDTRAYASKVYYRIFYVLEGGSYFFSRVKRATGAVTATGSSTAYSTAGDNMHMRDLKSSGLSNIDKSDKRLVTVKIKETIFKRLPATEFILFRDSILRKTKDTLFAVNDTLVGLHPYTAKEAWRPSSFIYSNHDGYINITLPQAGVKKYTVKFFEENGTTLYEIDIRESPLILDKSSFIHAGWFTFELYEDNKLKEKNKFYLPKDF